MKTSSVSSRFYALVSEMASVAAVEVSKEGKEGDTLYAVLQVPRGSYSFKMEASLSLMQKDFDEGRANEKNWEQVVRVRFASTVHGMWLEMYYTIHRADIIKDIDESFEKYYKEFLAKDRKAKRLVREKSKGKTHGSVTTV